MFAYEIQRYICTSLLHVVFNYWIFNVFLHSNLKLNFQGFTVKDESEYLKQGKLP